MKSILPKKLTVLIILGLGLGLRLVGLNQSLWHDEATTWWAATSFSPLQLIKQFPIGDFHPPLHYLFMWGWVRIFGESEISLRLPSVLFGVLTIYFGVKIAKIIGAPDWIVGGLLAVNGLLVYYSHEARMYMMATALVTAAMYFFLRHRYERRPGSYLLFLVMATAALYTHYLVWFALAGLAIWGVRYIAPFLFTVPWLPMLIKQFQLSGGISGNPAWAEIGTTSLKTIGLVLIKFVTGRVSFPHNFYLQIAELTLVAIFWGGVAVGIIKLLRKKSSWEEARVLLVFWGLVPLALGAVIGLFIPIFVYFRFIFTLPALVILFGSSLSRMSKHLWLVVMLGQLGFTLFYLLSTANHREDWRGAVAAIYQLDASPAVVVNDAVRPAFDYYERNKSRVIQSNQITDAVWYIPYASPIFDPNDMMRADFAAAGLNRTHEQHFRGVTIERWAK